MFASLEAVEASGIVLRGHFTVRCSASTTSTASGPGDTEWCDRRLLARIHRLTLEGLRRRIEPVSPTDYLRFLSRHHRVLPTDHRHGPAGVKQAVAQLQGFESPAAVWESQLVAGRVADYDPQWLDQLFMAGDLVWGRLRPPRVANGSVPPASDGVPLAPPVGRALTRAVPISLATRADLGWLLPHDRPSAEDAARGNAQLVLEAFRRHGALFWQELQAATDLLPGHLDEALRELAALGLVTSDGYSAVRAIAGHKPPAIKRRNRRQKTLRTTGPAGRWSLFPGLVKPPAREEYLARWCIQLLSRYGVVFRDILARESAAPSWSELAPVFRQLERRGEIRGGRFIAQVGGEQFAAEETVEQLRQVRDLPATEPWIVLSAADPLNLLGIVGRISNPSTGGRLPATHGGALVLEAGRYVAARSGAHIEFFADVPPEKQAEMTRALLRGRRPPEGHEDPAAKRFTDRLAHHRQSKAADNRHTAPRGDVPKPAVFPKRGSP
jgi:ATP-dependent Lhr-like helicase